MDPSRLLSAGRCSYLAARRNCRSGPGPQACDGAPTYRAVVWTTGRPSTNPPLGLGGPEAPGYRPQTHDRTGPIASAGDLPYEIEGAYSLSGIRQRCRTLTRRGPERSSTPSPMTFVSAQGYGPCL